MDELLDRSASLSSSLAAVLKGAPLYDQSVRIRTCAALSSLGMTHGLGVINLIAGDIPESATVVLRAQYEATLRAVWSFYAARDDQVSLLDCELTDATQNAAKRLPQAKDMLDALPGKAPQEAYTSLANFRATSWDPLNSFVHGGIHAVQRHARGYPPEILAGIVKHSNGLGVIAAMQAAVLTGAAQLVKAVGMHQAKFKDCMPI